MSISVEQDQVSVDPGRLRLDNSEGTAGSLLGMQCQECSVYVFGQAIFCQACTSDRLKSVDLSQRGILYSYTVVRAPPDGWPGPVPYVLGEVELPEGPHVLAEVVNVAEPELKIGLAVKLALRKVPTEGSGPSLVVYKWEPVSKDSEDGKEESP